MRMAALGNAFARFRSSSAGVALHQRHLLEVVGQNARSEEAGDAPADDDHMAQWTIGHRSPRAHSSEVSRIAGLEQRRAKRMRARQLRSRSASYSRRRCRRTRVGHGPSRRPDLASSYTSSPVPGAAGGTEGAARADMAPGCASIGGRGGGHGFRSDPVSPI